MTGTDTKSKAPDLAALKAEMRAAVAAALGDKHVDTDERAQADADAVMSVLFPVVCRYALLRMAVEVDMLGRLVIADDTKDDVVGMFRDRAAQLFRQAGA